MPADQDVFGQEDRLRQAVAIRVFIDVISGRQFERPGLSALIDHARPGDCLCVTRLDRLGQRPTDSPRRRAETARPVYPLSVIPGTNLAMTPTTPRFSLSG